MQEVSKFWNDPKEKNDEIRINQAQLIDFISKRLGFYKYQESGGNYQLVKLSGKIISEASQEDLKQSIKKYLRITIKREDVWVAFLKSDAITTHFMQLIEVLPPVQFNVATRDMAVFFYKNGVVLVHKDKKPELIPYDEYTGVLWENQINDREWVLDGEYQKAVFNTFLINIFGKNNDRYKALTTTIGYLLHSYKDPSFTKAAILLDEQMDQTGKAYGGTGKSLIAKALGKITPMATKDGKRFNGKDTFAFDELKPYHRLLYFDDVTKNFEFETFYSMITGDMRVQVKYKNSAIIPFSLSPKVLISTNYYVSGTGGNTDERRRIDFELAPYYGNQNVTPLKEFGHRMFDEWDAAEWAKFDTLMLRCVYDYMNSGVVQYKTKNLEINKIATQTHPDFIDFMEEEGSVTLETAFDKNTLLTAFQHFSTSNKYLTGIKFKGWLDDWAEYKGYTIDHYKSNGKD